MIKKCCFNCTNCFMSHQDENELICRINGVIRKRMSIEQTENQYCKSFEENNDTPDPFD